VSRNVRRAPPKYPFFFFFYISVFELINVPNDSCLSVAQSRRYGSLLNWNFQALNENELLGSEICTDPTKI
jgi:hypothetical protein